MITDEHLAGRHEMALLAIRIVNKSHAPEYLRVEIINNIVNEAVGPEEKEEPARVRPPYAKSPPPSISDEPLPPDVGF